MTVKEYNKIRRAMFDAAKEIPEVAEALKFGNAFIYDVAQLPDKHEIIVLNNKTQMHDNTLREHGFDPAACTVALKMRLNRATKCAEF